MTSCPYCGAGADQECWPSCDGQPPCQDGPWLDENEPKSAAEALIDEMESVL